MAEGFTPRLGNDSTTKRRVVYGRNVLRPCILCEFVLDNVLLDGGDNAGSRDEEIFLSHLNREHGFIR
jgi:hypothetical protein